MDIAVEVHIELELIRGEFFFLFVCLFCFFKHFVHVSPEVSLFCIPKWAGVELMDARHWVQQGHVLCAVERQTLSTVVMHHLWDAGEHAAALVQGVAVFFGLGNNDMNAALACSESHRGE